jgi:SulP family sulfate permease
MTGYQHDPDAELFGIGLANVVAPFFGGFAATGAIARTATNVRSGARSPIAALTHSAFVLVTVVLIAPLLGHLPMAALAALLLMVAWNMSELRHFVRVVRIAPRSDTAVLLTCFSLTVLFDMTVAVAAGVTLASLLFMRRMIEISGAELITRAHPEHGHDLPKGLYVFDIGGPLFFGAAHKATSQLFSMNRQGVRHVVLDLSDVPAMDATGLVNLESALDRLKSGGIGVSLACVRGQPREALRKAGLVDGPSGVEHHPTLRAALDAARAVLAPSEKP